MNEPLDQTWSQLLASYTYSDIGLVPRQPARANSRSKIDTSTNFCGIHLRFPLLIAPMSTLVDEEFAMVAYLYGIRACLPRQISKTGYFRGLRKTNCASWAIPSVGINDDFVHLTNSWYNDGCRCVLIDVANGYHEDVRNACQHLKDYYPDLYIITGNVASEEGYQYLHGHADGIRVGIGNGSVCTTSMATGVGLGQATAIRRVANVRNNIVNPPFLIADGGIKNPGDVAKALALGADVVMTGSIFTRCKERVMDVYAGEASSYVKSNTGYIEGTSFNIDAINTSIADVVDKYTKGLQSAMSYMGAFHLNQFKYLPDHCFVKLSDASKRERSAHYESKS